MKKSTKRKAAPSKKVRPSRAASLMEFESLNRMTEQVLSSVSATIEARGATEMTEATVDLLSAAADCLDQAEAMVRAATRVRVAVIRAQLTIGMTMEDVGAVHGLSRQRIGQLLDRYPPGTS